MQRQQSLKHRLTTRVDATDFGQFGEGNKQLTRVADKLRLPGYGALDQLLGIRVGPCECCVTCLPGIEGNQRDRRQNTEPYQPHQSCT